MTSGKTFILRDNSSREGVKRGLYEALKHLPLDESFQVTVGSYKENKTAEQRSGFHILCRLFGSETGYTEGEIKEMVLIKVFGTKEVMGVDVPVSSEKLKREQYSELIEHTYRLAAEAGVRLPALSR